MWSIPVSALENLRRYSKVPITIVGNNNRKRTKHEISAIMRRVRSVGTEPERHFGVAIGKVGLRPVRNPGRVLGKPDFLFPRKRVAIFIDGEFWHGNQWVRRNLCCLDDQFSAGRLRDRWITKIRRNMRRDASVTAQLISDGWKVLRFWSEDIMSNVEWCVAETIRAIRSEVVTEDVIAQKTFAEFFAGIGLVRMGLERQGWKIAFANDFDPDKKEIYEGHFGDSSDHFSLGDIHQIDVTEIPQVTLATASFPCNDLSLAGSRGGLHGKSSSAFWGFIAILEGMGHRKPPLVLLENVPGFITSHNGKDLREALLALNGLGYVVDPFILDAAHFVPQSRQRLFIVAVLTSIPHSLPTPPPNIDSESILRPPLLSRFIKKNSDILWYLRNLPTPPVRMKCLADMVENLPSEHPLWWNAERTKYLFNQFSPRHKTAALEMIGRRRWSYGTVFRRIRNERSMAELRTDGLAGCLRTPRGGSGRQILFKAGYGKYFARLLSPRECARLMGADEFRLGTEINLNQALFGFGDAVCVSAIQWIATYYLNPLVNELIRSRPN